MAGRRDGPIALKAVPFPADKSAGAPLTVTPPKGSALPSPMTITELQDETLRTSLCLMRVLENKQMGMHAGEYRAAAAELSGALRALAIDDLRLVARSMMPVLCELAENVLFERGHRLVLGGSAERERALQVSEALLARV